MEGKTDDGLQKVSLKSCGGGGFLCSKGADGFFGGPPKGNDAVFLLKPLGCKGFGLQEAPAFALIPESHGEYAVGVGPEGGVSPLPSNVVNEDCRAAFFIIDEKMRLTAEKEAKEAQQAAKQELAAKKAEEKVSKEAAKKAQQEAKEAKQAQKQEEATKKAEEKAIKEAEKKAQKEAQEAKQAAKQEEAAKKAEEKASKEAEKKAQKEAQEAKKIAKQEEAAKKAEEKASKEAATKAQKKAQEAKKVAKHEETAKKNKIVPMSKISDIADGMLVFIEIADTPGRLRIPKDGKVDVKGGWGEWTKFVVKHAR